jgi:hypothetical protein
MMRTLLLASVALATLVTGAPAAAHHIEYLGVPFATRGACESASAKLSAGDRDYLQQIGPQFFDTAGDVESFLTRAFTCDRNPDDGQYYFTDHREEVLESDWFAQRKH